VRVDLIGSGLSGYADSVGVIRIDNVPRGSYVSQFTAIGYDTATGSACKIFPPQGWIEEEAQNLRLSSSLRMVLISMEVLARDLLALQISGSSPGAAEVVFYAGTSKNVSARWDDHELRLGPWDYQTPEWRMDASLFYSTSYLGSAKRGFKSGDSVYLIAYTCRNVTYDSTTGYSRVMNLRNPSNVIGFVMP
jgi:hypothetical protein